MMNGKKKGLLLELQEREKQYLAEQEIGSEGYNASLRRLMDLERQIYESPENERLYKNILEGVKVVSGVLLPIIGLVCITATEKDCTFTGALKDYTKLFLPRKN